MPAKRRPAMPSENASDGILLWAYNTDARTYSGLNLNQDKATKPQTVQIVRQGEATPYWFKFNPL
ncbi:hypothetical protein [Neisseria lactamica]|uniref:hypothetical protein n=2 Tax=Neisseriaceae TaxID=481 RepID=UPI00030FAB48